MGLQELFFRLGLAFALGLIIGFQRERTGPSVAGVRTFPLISLCGFFVALLAEPFDGSVVAAGLLALAALLWVGFLKGKQVEEADYGITTEMAAVLVFAIGAYLATGVHIELAIVTGGAAAIVLYLKEPLHGLIARMNSKDIRAVMQFVLIAFVILPLLPDQGYGPGDILNPREIWMVVVLITGISLLSYALQKGVGERSGAVMSGLLGGLISSTATTVTYSKRAKNQSDGESSEKLVVLIIVLASTSALVRILAEVVVIAPSVFPEIALPLVIMVAIMGLASVAAYLRTRGQQISLPSPSNPSEVKAAVVFGLLYAGVLFLSSLARKHFGSQGLYAVALITGLTDVDAITISTAKLINKEQISPAIGWRVMLIASLANLAFKAGIVGLMGGRRLFRKVFIFFGTAIAAGTGILIMWPAGA